MALSATVKFTEVGASATWPRSSSSFTPANNSLLVVTVHAISADSATDPVVSVSGGSLTWTRQKRACTNDPLGMLVEIWTAPVSTGASMTVTVDVSDTYIFSGESTGFSVTEITGYDTGSPVGLTAETATHASHSGVLNLSLGGTTASSSIVLGGVASDGDNGDGAISGYASGYTGIFTGANTDGWFRAHASYKAGALSTYDVPSWSTAYGYAAAAIEIKAASTEITATASFTEPNETLSSSVSHPVLGTASFTESNETLSSDVAVTNPSVDANASFTEPNESLSATGTSTVVGVAAFTEPNESLSSAATHPVTGSAEFTEPNETLSAAASSALLASAAFTEPNETLSAAADHPVLGVGLQTAEPNETLTGAAGVLALATASFTEPNESLAALTGVVVDGVADFTEPGENLNSLVDTGVGFSRRVGGRMSLGIRIGL